MATTVGANALPVPELEDDTDVHADFDTLAAFLDPLLGGSQGIATSADLPTTAAQGALCLIDDTGDVVINTDAAGTPVWSYLWRDTGWLTSGLFTAASGFTITQQHFRVFHNQVFFEVGFDVVTSITVPSSGNIADTPMAVVSAAYMPQETNGMTSTSASGSIHQAFINQTNGNFTLSAVAPGTNLSAGASFSLSGFYAI